MKIALKISEKQLSTLVYCFKEIPKVMPKDRNAKVAKSVMDKVALKFQKKQLEIQHQSNLFNNNKKYSFSLEIVEAHFLEQFTSVMVNYPLNDYDRNVVRFIQTSLNQQLS